MKIVKNCHIYRSHPLEGQKSPSMSSSCCDCLYFLYLKLREIEVPICLSECLQEIHLTVYLLVCTYVFGQEKSNLLSTTHLMF